MYSVVFVRLSGSLKPRSVPLQQLSAQRATIPFCLPKLPKPPLSGLWNLVSRIILPTPVSRTAAASKF